MEFENYKDLEQKAVIVQWTDAHGITNNWRELDGFKGFTPTEIESFGILTHAFPEYLIIKVTVV